MLSLHWSALPCRVHDPACDFFLAVAADSSRRTTSSSTGGEAALSAERAELATLLRQLLVPPPPLPPPGQECGWCGAQGSSQCARCKAQEYCCREHQAAQWAEHRRECQSTQ